MPKEQVQLPVLPTETSCQRHPNNKIYSKHRIDNPVPRINIQQRQSIKRTASSHFSPPMNAS
ncbi:unnamed protein product [Periconia digitata]|uniref:Uncharacterized protein n=1 Tax=Periconia digitata TaxID=1303443 RepID=A0A9W4XN92_9PLEO|nr:unnamed protein product [Periconia digitata]